MFQPRLFIITALTALAILPSLPGQAKEPAISPSAAHELSEFDEDIALLTALAAPEVGRDEKRKTCYVNNDSLTWEECLAEALAMCSRKWNGKKWVESNCKKVIMSCGEYQTHITCTEW